MSRNAPWLALAIDWNDSPMFDDASHGVRLAWIQLLCFAKAQGRAGKVRLRDRAFANQYRLTVGSVEEMLVRATKAGAIMRQGDEVIVLNWKQYQDPSRRKQPEESLSDKDLDAIDTHFSKSGKKYATKHIHQGDLPSTKDHTPNDMSTVDLFEDFWRAFPAGRKHAKGKARVAWERAVKKAEPRDIVTAAFEYAASPVGRGEYVKGPEPWLNGECWNDDRAAWNRKEASNARPTHAAGPGQQYDPNAKLEGFG